jgi:hypothetical protein
MPVISQNTLAIDEVDSCPIIPHDPDRRVKELT